MSSTSQTYAVWFAIRRATGSVIVMVRTGNDATAAGPDELVAFRSCIPISYHVFSHQDLFDAG